MIVKIKHNKVTYNRDTRTRDFINSYSVYDKVRKYTYSIRGFDRKEIKGEVGFQKFYGDILEREKISEDCCDASESILYLENIAFVRDYFDIGKLTIERERSGKIQDIVILFTYEAYILNDEGKTIERLRVNGAGDAMNPGNYYVD